MGRRDSSLVLAALALCATACGPKTLPTPPPPQVTSTETQDSPERLERSNLVQVTAVVTHVDVAKRLVTVRDSAGHEQTIRVGPEVRNLPQVKRGDEVLVTYYESVIFQLRAPGSAEPGLGTAQGADRAAPGEKPGAIGAEAITMTATVVGVDKAAPSLTLKGPEGKVMTLPVRDASKLDPVKVGDLLQITYKRALAVAVEKP